MRLAIVSFPVPVSPTMSTLLALPAITRTKSNTVRMRGLRPTTIESNEKVGRSSTSHREPQRRCQRGSGSFSGQFRQNWRNFGRKTCPAAGFPRSEEHTSELQSHHDLVCRLLLEKKKK